MKIFIGVLETRSWSFQSFGTTYEEARKALKRAWMLHVKYTGATLKWNQLWDDGEAFVDEAETGVPYRDRERLI